MMRHADFLYSFGVEEHAEDYRGILDLMLAHEQIYNNGDIDFWRCSAIYVQAVMHEYCLESAVKNAGDVSPAVVYILMMMKHNFPIWFSAPVFEMFWEHKFNKRLMSSFMDHYKVETTYTRPVEYKFILTPETLTLYLDHPAVFSGPMIETFKTQYLAQHPSRDAVDDFSGLLSALIPGTNVRVTRSRGRFEVEDIESARIELNAPHPFDNAEVASLDGLVLEDGDPGPARPNRRRVVSTSETSIREEDSSVSRGKRRCTQNRARRTVVSDSDSDAPILKERDDPEYRPV
jgi:hypothetical protein